MKASAENPVYTVYLVEGKKKYNITPAVTDISMSNQDKQVAQSATIEVINIKIAGTKETLCQRINIRSRIFLYANDGSKKTEVFRGWVWTKYHKSELEGSIVTLKCYDNLIYLQESEDSLYYSKGKKTNAVMQNICNKWGIKLKYSYSTITHGKLVLRGTLTDIFMSDILDKVKKRTGKDYVIISEKDTMHIKAVGTNKTVYQITKKKNAVTTRVEDSMDGMITKVKILGQAKKKSKKLPVKAIVKGDTKKYGTLQKLQDKDKDTSLAAAKKEAQTTIKESGKPFREYEVECTDIPWIKKGDLVHVNAGHITDKDLIVISIDRSINNKAKKMTLTLKNAPSASKSSSSSKKKTTGTVYKVNASGGLNVRAGAGTQYKVISALKNGTKVTITKKQNGWGYVSSKKGWVSMSYMQKV